MRPANQQYEQSDPRDPLARLSAGIGGGFPLNRGSVGGCRPVPPCEECQEGGRPESAPARVAAGSGRAGAEGGKRLVVNRKRTLRPRGAAQVGSSGDRGAPEWGAPVSRGSPLWEHVRWRPRSRLWCLIGGSAGPLAPAVGVVSLVPTSRVRGNRGAGGGGACAGSRAAGAGNTAQR